MCTLAALTIAGGVISAGGALMQGKQAQVMAEAQARAQEQAALNEANASAFEMAKERRAQEKAHGAAIAQIGASGVALAGSPTEVLAGQARENEMSVRAIAYSSALRQNQLRSQADITRFQGKQARTASYLTAGSELLSGATRAVQFGGSPFARPADPWKGLR